MNCRQNQCVVLLVLLSLGGVGASGEDAQPTPGSDSEGKTHLLITRRPTVGSPYQQQKIGIAAVRRIDEDAVEKQDLNREDHSPAVARDFDSVVDQNEFKTVAPQFNRTSGNVGTTQSRREPQANQFSNSNANTFDFTSLRQGINEIAIEHDGLSRRLRIIVRPWINLKAPTPVIFCFHGAGGGPKNISGRFAQATRGENYVIVGVEAVKPALKWNFKDGFHEQDHDDVGLVKSIVRKMVEDKIADEKAIFAAGHSSGGLFCYRLAKETNMFAAIAPMSCGMVKGSHEPDEGTKPVPIFQLIGDQDMSFNGSENENVTMYSAEERIAIWRKFNGCDEQPTVERPHEGLVLSTYRSSRDRSDGRANGNSADVVLCIATGEGHIINRRLIRNADKLISRFFLEHKSE